MCGVCGVFNFGSGNHVPTGTVEAMCSELHHRGPDDVGTFDDGEFAFGMTRLSIVDLDTGHQPILNEDGQIAVICNGEIYNYPELRVALEARGHRFATSSDTEAIVHLYEDHGPDCLKYLRGMFALAVWDRRSRRLLIARDRLGIKPLHVWVKGGSLAFASELKALLPLPGVERELDPVSLDAYLALGYVPGPRTILRDVSKVMPGTFLVVDSSGVRSEHFWRLRFPDRNARQPIREEVASERLRVLLRDTVRQHLLADVPVGAFLSGGIDSTIVVALMSEFVGRPKTFSIGFPESSYNELKYARAVARQYGTDHSEFIVEPGHVEAIEDLVSYLDEPFGDLSTIPVYLLSALARRDVKVVLSGDGCDELFAGYLTYVADQVARVYRRLPTSLRRHLIPRVAQLLPTSYQKVSLDYKAKRFVECANEPVFEGHLGWKQVFSSGEREQLYRREYVAAGRLCDSLAPLRQCFDEATDLAFLDRLLHLDICTYLPDDILTKVDRMSMAHSLEVRVPFLDHEVVEFAAGLPPELKMRGLKTKYIVKKAFHREMPAEVRNRKKAGFIFPASLWLRDSLYEFANDLLSVDRVARMGVFEPDAVRKLLAEHRDGRKDRARQIWSLLVLSAWHDRYLWRSPGSVDGEHLRNHRVLA